MRKLLASICLLFSITAFAQSGSGFGVKGGFNFSSNGDLSLGENVGNIGSDTKTGYHLGVYGKLSGAGLFYLRPELMYTKTTSQYEYFGFQSDLEIEKLDLPVLVGINVLGPLHVFAGPSFQYILNADLEDVKTEDVENDFTVGLQFGAGINLGALGVDLRYERGFNENEAEIFTDFGGNNSRIDTRPSQFILSLSYKLL